MCKVLEMVQIGLLINIYAARRPLLRAHVGVWYKMASSASSKEWKEFLLSPKVLVPVGVVTVGIAATVGGYVCYRRHKGKSEQPKKPKASTTGPGLVSPPKSSDNAKVSGEGSNGADKDKKPANVPPTSNDEQGNKKDGSASEEKVRVQVCGGYLPRAGANKRRRKRACEDDYARSSTVMQNFV